MASSDLEMFVREIFSVEHIQRSRETLENFKKIKVLGEGAYGVVYKTLDRSTGEIVVVKQVKKALLLSRNPRATLREVHLLKNLVHPNIVHLKNALFCGNSIFLMVFEYMAMDLKVYLRKQTSKLGKMLVRSYTKQMLEALAYIHSKMIMHRDVKPANILVDREGNLKLADFGLSREYSSKPRCYSTEVITLWYRAPEILFGWTNYGPEVDMWSAACVMAELVELEVLFRGTSEIDQMKRFFRVLGTPRPQDVPPILHAVIQFEVNQFNLTNKGRGIGYYVDCQSKEQQDFLEKLFVYSPSERLSAAECLRMKYLQNVVKVRPANM